jgi:hypothetical protein
MFYVTGSHYTYMNGEGTKWFFYFVILGPNLAFIVHWLLSMRLELLKIIYPKSLIIFRIFSCFLIDPEAFKVEHMQPKDLKR